MRKIVIIVIIAILVAAVVLSSVFFLNGGSQSSASASLAEVKGNMVVWNKDRDQKLFESTDASAIANVITFIKTANWTSVKAEPTGENVQNAYNLTIYDENGKGEQYSMLYMKDNTIVLVYQKANSDGTLLQASFPVQAGGLNDNFKLNPAASSAAPAASASVSAAPSASAS